MIEQATSDDVYRLHRYAGDDGKLQGVWSRRVEPKKASCPHVHTALRQHAHQAGWGGGVRGPSHSQTQAVHMERHRGRVPMAFVLKGAGDKKVRPGTKSRNLLHVPPARATRSIADMHFFARQTVGHLALPSFSPCRSKRVHGLRRLPLQPCI